MIEVYKIINLKYAASTTVALEFSKDSKTRGNKHTLNQNHCKYDLHKNLFTGLSILNTDIVVDSIDDTFAVSISVSTILSRWGIRSSINDNFMVVFS